MSSRDSWVPIAAGVVVGAGLLTLLYKVFCGGGPYSKYQHNIGAKTFKCSCKKGEGIVRIHAEERERRLRAARSRGTSPPPSPGFFASLGALFSFGDSLFPIIGGSFLLMAGLFYKKYEEIKKFLGLGDKGPCDGFEPKSAPETFKPCRCDT